VAGVERSRRIRPGEQATDVACFDRPLNNITHLDLDLGRAEVVTPARHTVVEVEDGQVLVAARIDDTTTPFVRGEADPPIPDDGHHVERGEAEHARRPGRRSRASSPW
jgi:hypothetical protein